VVKEAGRFIFVTVVELITAAANIAESIGFLFGSNKVKTLERENTALHREVVTHEETIEALQDRIQFKEQFDKLRQNIRRPIQPKRKNGGMKL
jgi:hypothetical protein